MYFFRDLILILIHLYPESVYTTIDINAAELQYLADHLTPEECRRLIAAAHFQSFDEPNALDQAERKVPKDISCIEHLHHWNSQTGEGKGQTHELLQHRLRQMGKMELANWLGRTVFHQLGVDLERDIQNQMTDIVRNEDSTELTQITLEPLVPKIEDPLNYNLLDYLLYSLAIGIGLTVFGLCFKLVWDNIREKIRKRKLQKNQVYDFIETDSSGSEYEENKFDVRLRKNKPFLKNNIY